MSWTHLEDTKPKAAKDHRCYLCERVIPKGEEHILRVGVNEDGFDRSRMHIACEEKTRRWDQWEWECHDAATFREEVLKEAS